MGVVAPKRHGIPFSDTRRSTHPLHHQQIFLSRPSDTRTFYSRDLQRPFGLNVVPTNKAWMPPDKASCFPSAGIKPWQESV